MGDKVTQFIQQAFQKVGQVIVQSRVCFQPNFGEQKKLNKWFNFLFEEIDYVRRDLDPWRKTILPELVVDVYVGGEAASHVLLERWRFSIDHSAAHTDTDLPGAYKRAIIMFRALFTQLRLLPAYKLYRDYRKNRVSAPALSYAFSEGAHGELTFGARDTATFAFAPVRTPRGQLSLAVEYVENVAECVPRAREDVSLHTMVIQDYVTPPIAITGGPARSRGPSVLSQTPPHDMFTLEIGSPPLPPHPGSLAMSPQEYPLLFPQSPPPAFTLDGTTPVPQSPGAAGAMPIPKHATRGVLQVASSGTPSSMSAGGMQHTPTMPGGGGGGGSGIADGSPPFALYGTTPHSMQQSGLFLQTPPLASHMPRGLGAPGGSPGGALMAAPMGEHERRVVQLPTRAVVPFKTSPGDSPASSPPTHGPLLLGRRRGGGTHGGDLPFATSPERERERARSSRGSTPGRSPRSDADEELGSFVSMLAQPAELKLFGGDASASVSVASFDLSRFHDARRAMQADVPRGPSAERGE